MKKHLNVVLFALLILVSSFSLVTYFEKESLIKENATMGQLINSKDEVIVNLVRQVSEENDSYNILVEEYQSLIYRYENLVGDYRTLMDEKEVQVKIGDNIKTLIKNNDLPMYSKMDSCYPSRVYVYRYGLTGFTTITTDMNDIITSFNRLEDLLEYYENDL